MSMEKAHTLGTARQETTGISPPADPFIMVIFGASGDLTKRLLMPALYNLECDGLLSPHFGIVGIAKENLTTESFRDRMTKDIHEFKTRPDFIQKIWSNLRSPLHYI